MMVCPLCVYILKFKPYMRWIYRMFILVGFIYLFIDLRKFYKREVTVIIIRSFQLKLVYQKYQFLFQLPVS